MRIVLLLALAFFVSTAFGLYRVADSVQALEADIRTANRSIVKERQAIRVLEAEWAYLNNPERIQALTEEFLAMTPPDGRQVISFNDVPAQERSPGLPVPVVPASKPQAPEAMMLASFQGVSEGQPIEDVISALPIVTSAIAPVYPKTKPAVRPHATSSSTAIAVSKFEEMLARLKVQGTRGGAE